MTQRQRIEVVAIGVVTGIVFFMLGASVPSRTIEREATKPAPPLVFPCGSGGAPDVPANQGNSP